METVSYIMNMRSITFQICPLIYHNITAQPTAPLWFSKACSPRSSLYRM